MVFGLETNTVLGVALVIIILIILVKSSRHHDSDSSSTTTSTTKVVKTNDPNRYVHHPATNSYKNKYY
jgi:hypothetical protein